MAAKPGIPKGTRDFSPVEMAKRNYIFNTVITSYSIHYTKLYETDKRYADKNVEEISALVGFANRQSFYAAFYKNVGETPNGYRRKFMEKNK